MLRYIVERVSDGRFLELDFPLKVEKSSQALMKPGVLTGTVAPDVGGLRLADGTLIVDPYATYIHEEADGEIKGTWLVTYSAQDGDQWRIEGDGFSSFFKGRPYEGEYRGVKVDPVAVARHVVDHAQSFTGAQAGITVTGSSSVRVGTDSDDRVTAAQAVADTRKTASETAKKALDAERERVKKIKKPSQADKDAVEAKKTAYEKAQEVKKKADEALKKAKEQASEDGGAWKILWWDTPDVFTEFQDAVTAAGMEWFEWSGWNSDRTRILKELRVVPMVGRSRTDVKFVDDENLVESPVVTDQSDKYANTVIAIGAGEGRKALRVTVGESDSRLRKVHVLVAKDVTRKQVLEQRAREELTLKQTRYRVEAIRAIDHPNAPLHTFQVGDVVTVDADFEWIGRKPLRRRIGEIERVSEEIVDIFLED